MVHEQRRREQSTWPTRNDGKLGRCSGRVAYFEGLQSSVGSAHWRGQPRIAGQQRGGSPRQGRCNGICYHTRGRCQQAGPSVARAGRGRRAHQAWWPFGLKVDKLAVPKYF